AGFDARERALLVLERNKAGLVFDGARPAEELVQEAGRQARVHQPGSAAVFSLAAVNNMSQIAVSPAPSPARGPAVRAAAIEVELPLLARLAPESKVLGITIGQGDLDSCRRFAAGLAEVVRGRAEKPLLLISSDMNHFASDAENRRLDAVAVAALERGDPEE